MDRTREIVRELERHIRTVPNFPKPGISFKDIIPLIVKDIIPLIENGEALHAAVDALAFATYGLDYDRVLSAEARGFVLGTALAYRARKGLILARKPNKLPRHTISATYKLEYGTDSLEAHADAIPEGTRVLFAYDLLATGGTARAMCQLVENAGGIVAGTAFLIELPPRSPYVLRFPQRRFRQGQRLPEDAVYEGVQRSVYWPPFRPFSGNSGLLCCQAASVIPPRLAMIVPRAFRPRGASCWPL